MNDGMSDLKKKKMNYEKPELTRVRLNPSQAVLSICHATASTAMAGAVAKCRTAGCKKAAAAGDNAGHS